ncbi:uncharacterized protein LOC103949416 [Pyrus x bretschneideri]|uniref:uncharacterized protein LOC103949416 n=1 Tax=Pyrus x bretschneideri TaxID=225117 RepID=UPI00202E8822|nr:uncharacterized protein LOC103949416 [Pyrus x bretschneideri]
MGSTSKVQDNVVQRQTRRRTRHVEKAKVRTVVGLQQNDVHYKARKDAAGQAHVKLARLSSTPCERIKNQEKVLNVGVLDWGRLEKWKHKQKPFPEKVSGGSSLERAIGSSTSSVVVRNGTNAEQPSSRSSVKSSQKNGLLQGVKPSVRKDMRFQDSKTASKNAIHGQKKISFPRSLGRNHSDMMLDKGKAKYLDKKFPSEMGNAAANLKKYGVSFGPKDKVGTGDGRAMETESDIKKKNNDQRITTEKELHRLDSEVMMPRVEELHISDISTAHQHCPAAENTVVLSPSKELPQNDFPEVLQLSQPRASGDECMTEPDKISFSGDFSTKEMDFAELCSEVPHSCPLPSVVDTNTGSNMVPNSSINGKSAVLNFVPAHMRRCSNKTQDLLYEDKFVQKNSSEKMLTRSSFETSKTLDQEDVELATRKGRSPTPNRRFNFSLERLGRSLSFKESSDIPQLSSTYLTVKSGPVRSGTSDCSDTPNREKASTHNRARSSPLRRLLDPILKHKEANLHHSAEAVRPPKSLFNSFVPKPINISESLQNLKAEASWVKASLQITIKNGLPLFKFWVDNINCFAATMKNLSSGKDDFCQYFTFYSINEAKRKNGGWMSQGSKGKSCRYAYNAVAQMKVSSSDLSDVNGQDLSKCGVREAVMLGVDLTQADLESPSVVSHVELAAAVVKLPRKDLSHSEQQRDEEVMVLKGCAKDSSEDICSFSWEDSTIVILPGGVHSSPNKGAPSPLLERWKSGGLCDCGGWDVDCKLRVLSNQNKCCQIPKTCSACYPFPDTFELFAEKGAQENRPIFSLAPGKDGNYSVEFNTSLSLLQAFFSCVVVISSCKPLDLSEVNNVTEAKDFQEPNLNQSNGIQVTGPAKYAPNPPMSPVERV